MGYMVPVSLEAFVWGFIVLQKAADAEEYASLLRDGGVEEKDMPRLMETYAKYSGFGGYCQVNGTHAPWAILIFKDEPAEILKTFAHELVHLVDRLSEIFEARGDEVRASIGTAVMAQFTRIRSISISRQMKETTSLAACGRAWSCLSLVVWFLDWECRLDGDGLEEIAFP